MYRIFLIVVVVTAVCFQDAMTCAGVDDMPIAEGLPDSDRQILAEFDARYEELQKFYHSVDVTAEASAIVGRTSSPDSTARYWLQYRARDDKHQRTDRTLIEFEPGPTAGLTRPSVGRREEPGMTLVKILSERGYIEAIGKLDPLSMELMDSTTDTGVGVSRIKMEMLPHAPFTVYLGAPVRDFIYGPAVQLRDYTIQSVKVVSAGEQERESIELRATAMGVAADVEVLFRLVVDRQTWAVKEFSLGPKQVTLDSETIKGVVNYEGERHGIPLLKNARYWTEVGKAEYSPTEFVVTDLHATKPPTSLFSAESIGLTVGFPTRKISVWWALTLATGVVLVVVYLVSRRWAAT